MGQKTRHFLVVIKHSEIANDPRISSKLKEIQPKVVIPSDPQLSRPTGKQQAIDTGEFLKSYFEDDLKVDLARTQVYYLSSPFLACLETAAALSKQLLPSD